VPPARHAEPQIVACPRWASAKPIGPSVMFRLSAG
jgi:hypothetical protein